MSAPVEYTPIIGEIRPMLRDGISRYYIWNGDSWVTFDDPSVDKVFELMQVGAEQARIMREYYTPPVFQGEVDEAG